MQELNLRGVKCPLNFVKAKLALEKLVPGTQLKIILDLGEASETIPQSLRTEGYIVASEERKENYYELIVYFSESNFGLNFA